MELIHRFLISFLTGLLGFILFISISIFTFSDKVIFPKERETAKIILNLAKERALNLTRWDEKAFLSILGSFKNKFVYVHFINDNRVYPPLDSSEGFTPDELKDLLQKNIKAKNIDFHFVGGSWPLETNVYGSSTPNLQLQVIAIEKNRYTQTMLIWLVAVALGLLLLSIVVISLSYIYFKPVYERFEKAFASIIPPSKELKYLFSLNGLKQLAHLKEVYRARDAEAKQLQEYQVLKKEIALAESIQANQFPDHVITTENLSIVSVFGTATRVTGDWWFHKKLDGCDFLLLADASGHGMPAALITSAATAVTSTVDWNEKLTVAEILQTLNRAVYNVGKAKIHMTALAFKFDWINKKVSLASASHEFPYWYKNSDKTMDALIVDKNCPRLGESEKTIYSSSEIPLEAGDTFILYTDGIMELFQAQKKKFSEKQFVKKIRESCENNKSAVDVSKDFTHILQNTAGLSALPDDTTYIVCRITDV